MVLHRRKKYRWKDSKNYLFFIKIAFTVDDLILLWLYNPRNELPSKTPSLTTNPDAGALKSTSNLT